MENHAKQRFILLLKIFGLVAVSELLIMLLFRYFGIPEVTADFLDPVLLTLLISFPLWKILDHTIQIKGQQLEKEFQSREAYLLQRLKTIDKVGIVSITDAKGLITYANDNFIEISEFTLEELIGKNHRIVNSGVHSKEFWKDVWTTLLAGKPWRGHVCNRSKSGTIYWVEANILPLFDSEGKICEFISIRFNITKQKEMEATYEKEKLILVQKSRMTFLSQLAAGVAHEVNNPLAIIQGKISTIQRRSSSGQYEIKNLILDLQKISETCGRIEKVVKGLRALEGLGTKEEMESLPIDSVIEQALDFLRERLVSMKIELRLSVPKDIYLECRSKDLSYAIMNLLLNAYDAVVSQEEKWIRIDVKQIAESVEIDISDSGPRIPAGIREKIGTPFFTTKEIGKGMGIGLSITRGILQSHGGTLELSESAVNTQFEIRLPIKRGSQVDVINVEEAISAHLAWKQKLVNLYLNKPGVISEQTIDCDRNCALGTWIERQQNLDSSNPVLLELDKAHREFHHLAAKIYRSINRGDKVVQELLLNSNSEFENKSNQVIQLLGKITN